MHIHIDYRDGKYKVGRKKFDSFLEAKHYIDNYKPSSGLIRDCLGFGLFFFMVLYGAPWLYYLATGEFMQF